MSGPVHVLAEFADVRSLNEALEAARQAHHRPLDTYTPFPVEGVGQALGLGLSKVPRFMAAGGLLGAVGIYFFQWWSAVVDYPIDSGGRPLDSWPAFLVATFEVGVLAAAFTGLIALLVLARLPRLYEPLHDIDAFERAAEDRFFLEIEPERPEAMLALRDLLDRFGAVALYEVSP